MQLGEAERQHRLCTRSFLPHCFQETLNSDEEGAEYWQFPTDFVRSYCHLEVYIKPSI